MARRVIDLRPRSAAGGDGADAGPPRRRRRARRPAPDDAAPAVDAPPGRPPRGPDPFAQRLKALEREIEDALARSGGIDESRVFGLARSAGEEILGVAADLGRAFASGGLEDVVTRLRLLGVSEQVDDFGCDPRFRARARMVLAFLFERWWRVEVEGVTHVPGSGRVLLVANHSGGLFPYDGWMIGHAVEAHHPGGGRVVRPLVEDAVYHVPFCGPALSRAGAVRASAENARRLLAREQAIVVFPEGAKGLGKYYAERYRLQRFGRGGFVTLALTTQAPLVPVAVVGGEEIHPVLAKWQWLARLLDLPYFPVTPTFPWLGVLGLVPLPSKWRIVFGAPVDLAAELGPNAWEDELLVNRCKEKVREQIQRMLLDALRARSSVFS